MYFEHRLSVLFQLHFILNLTSGFKGLGKDNCKTRQETFKFGVCGAYIRGLTVSILRLYLQNICCSHHQRVCSVWQYMIWKCYPKTSIFVITRAFYAISFTGRCYDDIQ